VALWRNIGRKGVAVSGKRGGKDSRQGGGAETREKILDAAEALFAEYGFEGASMRMITARAGVNLAAVNYHFGSKENLLCEIFRRRLAEITEERRRRLAQLQRDAEALGKAVRPSRIVEAFFAPLLELARTEGGRRFLQLLGRTMTDPSAFVRHVLAKDYGDVTDEYLEALYRSLPGVPHAEIFWRFHFMLGAVSYAIAGAGGLQQLAGESFDDHDPAKLEARLMSFLLGGLRAPLPDFAAQAHAG
jgi:AcrR family transcriptional regulator